MNDLNSQAFKIRNLIIELVLSCSPFPLATAKAHSLGKRETLLILSIFREGLGRFSNSEVTDITCEYSFPSVHS